MPTIHDFQQGFEAMMKRIRKLEAEVLTLKQKASQTEDDLYHPDKSKIAYHNDPVALGFVQPDERFIGEVTEVVDANNIKVKRIEATARNTWQDIANRLEITVGAPNHNYTAGDLTLVFWDGNNEADDTPIYHAVQAKGASGTVIYTVATNHANGGTYICNPGSTTVVNFEEKGDVSHALVPGTEMICWKISDTLYGLTRYAKTKS